VRWEVLADGGEVAQRAAQRLLAALRERPFGVLGLPTGSTPVEMYRRVVRACRRGDSCFARATTFNLDEYVGLPPGHPGSYRAYMERNLFARVDLRHAHTHVPDGGVAGEAVRDAAGDLAAESALARECARYEAAIAGAGGLGVTFLGLGVNGHIAFNEPGAPFASRTRVVELAAATRRANAPYFPGERVPRRAITMGVGTILESRALVLLAVGEAKREAVARLRGGEVSEAFPASALHGHRDVTVLVDAAAAGKRRPRRIARIARRAQQALRRP
jgi:glucosamine-6-phosphate deaminase